MSDAHTPDIPYAWEELRPVEAFLSTIFNREKTAQNKRELERFLGILAKIKRRASVSVKELRADEAAEMFELAEVIEREFHQAAWMLRAVIAELYLHQATVWLEALTTHADGFAAPPEDELLQLVRFTTATVRAMHKNNSLMTRSEEFVMCFEALAEASRYETEVHLRAETVRRFLARAHEDAQERASEQRVSRVRALELERMFNKGEPIKPIPKPRRSSK